MWVPTQILRKKFLPGGFVSLPQTLAEADCMFLRCNMRSMSAKFGFHTNLYSRFGNDPMTVYSQMLYFGYGFLHLSASVRSVNQRASEEIYILHSYI